MIPWKEKILLSTCLAGLFAAGSGTGYFVGYRRGTEAQAGAPQASPPPYAQARKSADWWNGAMSKLTQDLALTDQQSRAVQPMLEACADRIFRSRDLAMFQVHLELLSFHETLSQSPGLLDAAQQQKLENMKKRLRSQIQSQFPQFLKDQPLPPSAA
jgi:hypothetical protein